jgi:hypothetical protein
MSRLIRRLSARGRTSVLFLALGAALLVAAPAAHAQAGPPGGGIYAHDELFRVVATPRDLPPNGMFDTIYVLGSGWMNVSNAGPGDPAYNGGRWEVRLITWSGMSPTQFTNAEQILQAAAAGQIQIGDVVRRFECPLIRTRHGG